MEWKKERKLALVWDDKDSLYKSIPLDEVTQEDYDTWTNFFGFTPSGKTDLFLTK